MQKERDFAPFLLHRLYSKMDLRKREEIVKMSNFQWKPRGGLFTDKKTKKGKFL